MKHLMMLALLNSPNRIFQGNSIFHDWNLEIYCEIIGVVKAGHAIRFMEVVASESWKYKLVGGLDEKTSNEPLPNDDLKTI